MHIADDDKLSVGEIRVSRVEVLISDRGPAHASLARAVDNARVDLAE